MPPLVVREMKTANSIIDEERARTSSGTTRRTRRSSSIQKYDRSSQITSLSVATLGNIETEEDASSLLSNLRLPSKIDAITKVLSASLLVTGNTVGSSMFVLPEAVSGIGMVEGTAIFVGKCSRALV